MVAAAALVAVVMAVAAAALVVLAMVVATTALVVVAMFAATAAFLVSTMLLGTILRPVKTGGDGVGLLLVEHRDGLGAQLGATDGIEHVVERKGHVGAGQRKLAVVGIGERQAQVLDEVLDHKAGLVIAVERLGRQTLHGAGLAGTAQNHLTGLLQIEAAQLGKRQRIGHADHAGAQRHLVGELGSLALAGAVEAADGCRKGGKDIADRGNVVLGSPR